MFTQTTTETRDRPLRDEDSTTYIAAIENAEEFGLRLYTEAWRRGWSRAKKKVLLGDGAVWIWNLAHQHCPGAVQIVDLYHARQHLWELSAKLFPADEQGRQRWTAQLLHKLDQGNIETVVKTLRQFSASGEELARLLSNAADYFQRNAERMRYPQFRAQGLFVGSGVVEAACKDRRRRSPQAFRHVLDRPRRQRHPRPALLPPQSQVRRLLGGSITGRLTLPHLCRTPIARLLSPSW